MTAHNLETREFSLSDVQRTVAWAGIERPSFMDPAATPRDAARQFLNGNHDQYIAVIDRNPETGFPCVEEEFRGGPRRNVVLGGPIACLRRDFNGEVACVYIDPLFRNRPVLVNEIDNLVARANNRPAVPMPAAARLVAA